MTDASSLTPEQLADALRAGAQGVHVAEAAVELLIQHESWLWRTDFRAFVDHERASDSAGVRWDEAVAANLPCSSSERQMLGIAASLAERSSINLGDSLTGLDRYNIRLVAAAVLRTVGGAEGPTLTPLIDALEDPPLIAERTARPRRRGFRAEPERDGDLEVER